MDLIMIFLPFFKVGMLARKNLYSKMHQFCICRKGSTSTWKEADDLSDEGQSYLRKVLEIEECFEPFNQKSLARMFVVNYLDHFGSVRFGSVRFGSVRFGSVRFG
jgi:hypothetical protein